MRLAGRWCRCREKPCKADSSPLKKFLTALTLALLLTALYWVEYSKIRVDQSAGALTLDNLERARSGELWDLFYRVRVTLVDGNSADFKLPAELRALEGQRISLSGAAAFRSDGARALDAERVAIRFFDLLPLVALAYGCDNLPDVAMRWTIVVTPRDEWVLIRSAMIDAEVAVEGVFRIDTSQPYNAAFFMDDATVDLIGE